MGIGDTYVFGHEESGYNRETYDDKMILIELICNKQTKMILNDPTSYDSSFYKKLEELKVKIKDANQETIINRAFQSMKIPMKG